MDNSVSGRLRIDTHGVGPQSGRILDVSELRDAVGYSKQVPVPAREVTLPGIVRLAGSTYVVNTTGILDGNKITGLAATDGLVGAAVAGDNIEPDATVVSIDLPALGAVTLSKGNTIAPTGLRQALVFTIPVTADTIIDLPATDDLSGARVSGGGLPDGTVVQKVTVPAVAATNTRPGVPGEILLTLPPTSPEVVPASPEVEQPPAPPHGPGHLSDAEPPPVKPKPDATKPAAKPPVTPAGPVDIKFAIPSRPIIIPDNVSRLQLTLFEPIKELEVTLPANPVDGQVAFIYSTLEIGALTVLANVGQALNWSPRPPKDKKAAPAGLAANNVALTVREKPPFLKLGPDSGVGYLYSSTDKTWDRIQ
jgi:hypothetical protein